MNVLVETERLIITEMTMDMAMDIHKNSLDEDTRRFVPDEVFETLEDAKETVEFLMSQYGSTDGPLVYAVILKVDEVKAFLPLMAKIVGIEEVYGIRLLENVSSGRVLEKCGFETFFEGEGEYHDGVYEISKSVWKGSMAFH